MTHAGTVDAVDAGDRAILDREGECGFGIEVELRICLPGIPRSEADSLVEKAHAVCPYSNATRDNLHVRLVIA